MSTATNLSAKDQRVLSAIFQNGESGPTTTQVDVDLAPDQHVANVEELVAREKQAIAMVEVGQLESAREVLDSIITSEPSYASAYNNRAQLRRLCKDEALGQILLDLQRAIQLAEPASEGTKVSKMQGNILCQAYSQLGGLYLQMSQEAQTADLRWETEEKASNALYMAGLYGNELAKAVATKVNPYAKLCGNMVRDALIAEYS